MEPFVNESISVVWSLVIIKNIKKRNQGFYVERRVEGKTLQGGGVLHRIKGFTNNGSCEIKRGQITRSNRSALMQTCYLDNPIRSSFSLWLNVAKMGALNGSFGLSLSLFLSLALSPSSSVPCTIHCPRLMTNQAVTQRYMSNDCFPVCVLI